MTKNSSMYFQLENTFTSYIYEYKTNSEIGFLANGVFTAG